MSPDDPRHGTYAGSIQHYLTKTPTCQPCRTAAATYRRQRRARLYLTRTTTLETNPTGSIRRIQALVAIGHSMRTIDDHLGWAWGTTSRYLIANHKTTHRTTADRIATVYQQLCMTTPTGPYANRNRKLAERKGWAPPLAWDNIDDPNERPTGMREERHRKLHEIDPVVVERFLSGDWSIRTTKAEKHEIARRWVESGRSLKSLGEATGWKPERYAPKDTAA